MSDSFSRLPKRDDACMVPEPISDRPGLFMVDGTWGEIAPMRLAPGVETIGELEVIEHARQERPLVDTRLPHFVRAGTIAGAKAIPHEEIIDRMDELDRSVPTVFFCNGPQCAATPAAIEALLAAGYPADKILYYRGGMHDWVTLGFPVTNDCSR